MIRRQIAWFAVAGVAGFIADAAVLYLALGAGLGPYGGRVLSFLAAVAVTWAINRRHTFEVTPGEPLWREGLRYLAAMAFGGAVNFTGYGTVIALAPATRWTPLAALVVGTGLGMVCNFLSARYWVYRQGARTGGDATPARPRPKLRTRIAGALAHPAAPLRAAWLAPVVAGLVSLWLGQDSNWDLLNYHLYNAYALLGGRVGGDLAPAQFQSYFNPLLDVPYFAMVTHWPAPLAGFAMGAFHGLSFALVLFIARRTLGSAGGRSGAVAILLALAGCLGPAFLSELGNTMGDNSTAPLVLAALALLVWRWSGITAGAAGAALAVALAAGLLMGASVGLKLTNAVYAVALCLALLTLPGAWWRRFGVAFVFGLGVLAGIAATSGYWFATMWQVFGNPLFPQFNAWFGAPLAAPISIVDLRWLPKGIGEALLFPFAMVADARRVNEVPMRPLIWPVLWLLVVAWAGTVLLRRSRAWSSPAARFVVVFVGLAFVTWMAIFSIYRYAVAMELLAPLCAWLLMHRVVAADAARRVATVVLVVVAASAVVGARSWGREGWDAQAFRVEVPPLPATGTILLIGSEEPLGWMAPYLPAALPVAGVATNFPESPAFVERVRAMVREGGGQAWGVMPAAVNRRAKLVATLDGVLARLALPASGGGCRTVSGLLERTHVHARVEKTAGDGRCTVVLPPEDIVDLDQADRALVVRWSQAVARYGLAVDAASCRRYRAWIGATPRPYQLCKVALTQG
ncbi:GtrA family protein [Cupriavidus respiraculi]|uniref:GtrA family protein n=1 Tax=Cupriavidus respiraculi TaxID=195930 RepID=UPI001C96625E|nr:GtrA family protein [Cupriavidus respiraculi]MBY4949737.1 GtrA family protein [Cupriavidus respiraculi]